MKAYTVTFYFISGESMAMEYSEEKWNNDYKLLEKNWNQARKAGLNCGVNFSHVTHYRVRETEE